MPIRLLIADDHEVVRQGLRSILGGDPEITIVGEAEDGQQAIALARKHHPDVVLMDIVMPHIDGLAALAAIRAELPNTRVLVLTTFLDEDRVLAAVRAGAIGYLLKDTRAEALRQAVKAAADGHVQLSPEAAALLMQGV